MCLIIDASAISSVFNNSNENHHQFKPVLDWLVDGKGKIVYGGSKYKRELAKTSRYVPIINELGRSGKVVLFEDALVDDAEAELKEKISECNDCHLIAIVLVSGCRIICTNEDEAIPFLKKSSLYKGPIKRPKVYRSKRNKDVLNDNNIAACCLPCVRMNKQRKEAFCESIF